VQECVYANVEMCTVVCVGNIVKGVIEMVVVLHLKIRNKGLGERGLLFSCYNAHVICKKKIRCLYYICNWKHYETEEEICLRDLSKRRV
jgi:hypothetical protein